MPTVLPFRDVKRADADLLAVYHKNRRAGVTKSDVAVVF